MLENLIPRAPPVAATSTATIALILAFMALLAIVEAAIPLRARGQWNARHLGPNLALTFLTFATNFVLNLAIVAALVWLQSTGGGLFNVVRVAPPWATLGVVLSLDFSFYVAHVAMHKVPLFWAFHKVHHCDPAVDVTTSLRQHPVEGVIRYVFIALAALPLGASPIAFAVYRTWSALNALLEHANIRAPARLDGLLSLITTRPLMHKVHHSRNPDETDSNYGNIFSWWDRLFFTFTKSSRGAEIAYGLEGHDAPAQQTVAGLLAMPFQDPKLGQPSEARQTL